MTLKNIKQASRKDVAKAAGVSLTTVTHALNPKPETRVNSETRERVRRIASELNYRPSFVGRALVTGKNFSVGLLQPGYEAMFRNFYQHMAYGMVESMGKDDYNLLLVFRDEQKNYLRTISQGRVDGMIVLQSDFGDSHIENVIETNIPTVVLNRTLSLPESAIVGCVASDHVLLIEEVFKGFLRKGCKNIVAFNDQRNCDPNFRLFEAFTRISESLIKDGIIATTVVPSKERFAVQINNLFESGQCWDGIYIDGEELLLPLIKGAMKFGLKPGRNFELILSSVEKGLKPADFDFPVTVYLQQPEVMGVEAWKMLKGFINREKTARFVKVPYKKEI
jgi:LacI family transcriptional regulator